MIKLPLIITRLFVIVQKNLKRLLSSKISASIILLGPLVMIFLMGAAFQDSGFFGVKIGVYSDNYNDISDEIVKVMEKTDFIVVEETSAEECIENVRRAKTHLCVDFPSDFKSGKLKFYVDYSRLNLVYAIVSKISAEITTLSEQISLGTAEDILSFLGNSTDQLEASGATLITLRENAKDMQMQMVLIADTLHTLNIQEKSDVLNEMSQDNGRLSQNFDDAIQLLDNMDTELVNTKSEFEDTVADMTQSIVNIDLATSVNNCTTANSFDFSEQLTSKNYSGQLADEHTSVCSLLLTFKNTLKGYKSDIERTLTKIDGMRDSVIILRDQIAFTKEGLQGDALTAQAELEKFEELKQNLTFQLIAMSKATGYGVEIFDIMAEQIAAMTSQFEDLSLTDAQSVVKPIRTSIKPLTTKKINTLDIIFPAILVMIIMFVGILIGNILVMREKTSKAYFRNLVMPVQDYVFITGTYITTIIVTLVQISIIMGITSLFFSTSLEFNILNLLPILLLSIVAFASIGMIIGYLANSEETSTMAAISLSIILLLFSNMIIPIETMEQSIGIIARYTPFNVTELLLRRTLLLGSGLASLDFLMMAVFFVQLVLLIAGVYLAHIHEGKRKK